MRVLNYKSHTGAAVVEVDDGSDVTYTITGNPEQVAKMIAYLQSQFPVEGYVTRVTSNNGSSATVTRWNNCN
jgi:hypothetical protein